MSILITAILLLMFMLLAIEVGYQCGLKTKTHPGEYETFLLGTVEGATLGLVALLLGFSFAAAGERFFQRNDNIIAEANAIGTAYLRADLLQAPCRDDYKKALREYTDSRIVLFDPGSLDNFYRLLKVSENLQPKVWKTAIDCLMKTPHFDETVLPPLNEAIDLHTVRLSKAFRHTSYWVLGVLVLSCLVALGTMGFGCGLRKRRYWWFTASIALLLTMVLWLVVDLDHPRQGLIQIDQTPLLRLQENFNSQDQ